MKAPRYDIVDLSDEFQNTTPTKKDVAKYLASIAGNNIFFESADGKIIGVKNDDDKIQHIKTGKNYNEKTRREIQNKYKYILSLGRIVNNSIENKESQPPRNQNAKPTVEEYHYFRSYIKIGEKYFELKLVIEEFKEIEKTKKIGEMRAHTSQEESQSADSGLNHTLQHSPYNDNTSPQQVLSTPVLYVYDIFETYLNQRIPNPEEYIRNKQYRDAIQTYQDTEYALELLQQEAERKGITLQEDDLKITYDAKGYPEKLSDRIKQIQQRNTIQKETHNMENENTRTQEQQKIEQNVTNTLIEKIRKTGLDVIIDKEKMREILDSGQYVQKMAAYHGTSHENESETFFNGYGTYVVSVNENYAKQHGLKIASKKYGDTFYVKEQTLNDFLSEHNFSPYWNELIRQSNFRSPDELHNAMMIADTKGNAELERQKGELSTLFKYSLIEYKKEQTYLYSVDIPDNTGKNYLLYNNPIGLENANRINAELEKMNVEWKVSRNDTGRQVYFDVLSKNLFNGNQKTASEFLKNCGYVGMEMDSTNYIVFDENDMNVKNRLQYMIDGKNNVLGLAAGNAVILDPDFLNSNTPAHEYNHFWDRCIRQSNPELIAKGIDIFKETDYWSDVEKLQSYKEGWSKLDKTQDEHGISNYDYEVFSEMHSRIVGQFASEVLTRIAVENGGDIADAVIDWDKEAKEYIAREFGNEFPEPELGSETYEYDSAKQKYIQDFFAQPMKDLMNGIQIIQKNDFVRNEIKTDDPVVNYELGKIQESGIKVNLENGDIKETLAWLNEVNIALEMLEEDSVPIQLMEGDLKNKKPLDSIPKIYDGYIGQRGDSVQTNRQYEDNLSGEKSQDALNGLKELSEKISMNGRMNPAEFLGELQKITHVDEQKSHCIRHYIDNEQYNLRISNHSANAVHAKLRPNETSVVIKLSSPKFHKDKESYLVEYVYESKNLTSEKQLGIITGLRDWIQTGEYTDKGYNKDYYSPSEELWKIAKGIQQHAEPIEQNNITNQKENTMENNFNYVPDNEYFANWENMSDSEKQESSTARKEHFDVFVKAMKEQGINNQQELDDYIQNHINDDVTEANPWMKPYGENNLKNLVRARQDFIKAHPEVFREAQAQISELENDNFINILNESEQAINEATNGMGHDPTDGLPLDFNPPLTQEELDMWAEIAGDDPYEDTVFDMYETKDGKLFYPEEIVPSSVEESLKNVYQEKEVDTTARKVDAYASEIHSILSNFSTANSADWNVDNTTAVTLHHLAEVADIKNSEREESIEKIKEYFTTDEYAKEEESIGKTFSGIIKTKNGNGYDFDFAKKWEETYFQTQNMPSLSEDINLLSRNEIGLKDECITISNHTPYIFKNLNKHGFEDEKIAIYKDKLARGLFLPVTERHGHDNSLTKENVAETFENLANPRAILLSKDGKSLIGVYDVPDKKNEPMMVSFRPENGQIEVNLMTSIYGKPEKDIEHWIDNGQLLYVNDMEKEKAFTLPSRQLRISDINTSSLNIQTKSEIVNELTLDGKIEIPTFAMATKNGLRTCEHFKVESINKEQKKITVSNDKGEKIAIDENAVKAIVNPEIDALTKKKNGIVWTGEKVPEFAMITQHGLQTFKDMTVEKYNAESKSWTLSNADGQSVNVTDLTLKELTSNQRMKQVQKFTNDTLARDKMLVTQYNDYFKQRDNTAYNFRHNLSVYCRKEANSPVDALKIANLIIKEMPTEERRKTKELLNTMRRDGETVNQVIVNMYTEAVKDVPLNESYIANNHHDKKIARPMYDTLSVKGEKIDRDFNLKIGDNVSNMAFKMGKTFGIGKETLYQNCTIVSASKEGNVVTLMDGNKSYYDVPRDTFLKEYAKQQKHEQKLENHQQRQHRYNMQMSVEY